MLNLLRNSLLQYYKKYYYKNYNIKINMNDKNNKHIWYN